MDEEKEGEMGEEKGGEMREEKGGEIIYCYLWSKQLVGSLLLTR